MAGLIGKGRSTWSNSWYAYGNLNELAAVGNPILRLARNTCWNSGMVMNFLNAFFRRGVCVYLTFDRLRVFLHLIAICILMAGSAIITVLFKPRRMRVHATSIRPMIVLKTKRSSGFESHVIIYSIIASLNVPSAVGDLSSSSAEIRKHRN